jgi:hypothetical protein
MIIPKSHNNGLTIVTYALVEPKGTVFDGKPLKEKDLLFDIYTYNKYYRTTVNNWGLLAPMNNFIDSSFTKEEYEKIVIAMHLSKKTLSKIKNDEDDVLSIIQRVDDILYHMTKEVGFVAKLTSYIERSNISTPEFKKIGKRAQDTPAMTFVKKDYMAIYELILLCKVFFPLFGELISLIKDSEEYNSDLKEKYCLGLFKTIRDQHFDYISSKLLNYIDKISARSQSSNLLLSFHGYTQDILVTDLYASMLIKKFVNTNLFEENGDIMKFIYTCIKKSMNSKYGKFLKDNKYSTRFDPGDKFEDEDAKVSFLENSGTPSKTTTDIPILTKIGIRQYIGRYISDNNIDMKLYHNSVETYSSYSISMTPINEFLLSMFVGDDIGGAVGLMYLEMDLLIRLSVIVQDKLIKMGLGDLAPLLTMIKSDIPVTELTAAANSIIIKRGHSTYYKNCQVEYSHLGDSFSWAPHFDKMINYLVKHNHQFVISDEIYKLHDFSPNKTGDRYMYKENIIEELFKLVIILNSENKRCILN